MEEPGIEMWEYNKIVIRKNKNVPLHFNKKYPLLLEDFLDEICKFNYFELKRKEDSEIEKTKKLTILQRIFSIKNQW